MVSRATSYTAARLFGQNKLAHFYGLNPSLIAGPNAMQERSIHIS